MELVTLMPALRAIHSPTVNSYRRYVPGVWAPMTASWGCENRTAAVRLIPGSAKSTRLEYRQTAADINPYLSIPACLAAGLNGVDKKLDPPGRRRRERGREAHPLPRTLRDAVDAFERNKAVREVIGDAFVDHWSRTRRHEIARHERAVSDWELARYFEII